MLARKARMRKLIAIIAALSAMLLALPAMAGHDENPSPNVRTYTYSLDIVGNNTSGASGEARLTALPNGKVQVKIQATGLTPGVHAQHLHGVLNASETGFVPGACPTISDDGTLGRPVDGLIDTLEGVLDYGFVRASLTTTGDTSPGSALAVSRFPIADADGVLEYERTFTPTDARVWDDLGALEVVIHGVDLDQDGDYPIDFDSGASSLSAAFPLEATIPALCGGPGS